MEANGNLTVDEWKTVAPTADMNLLVYSKLMFRRDGSLYFFLKEANHSVKEEVIFIKRDNIRRALFQ